LEALQEKLAATEIRLKQQIDDKEKNILAAAQKVSS
jgi:hypothetical protein